MSRAAALAMVCLLAAAHPAQAEGRSVSHSLWVVSGNTVMLRYTLPLRTAAYLAEPGWPLPNTATVARYVLAHMSVNDSGGTCAAVDQGYDIGLVDALSMGADVYSFEIVFRCAHSGELVLHDAAFFDRVPQHTDFAVVRMNGGKPVAQLITASNQAIRLHADGSPNASGVGRFAQIGFMHVFGSFDRWCFLIGVLLIARRRTELICIGTGLSLGYMTAAAVAASGAIAAHANYIDAWIGFMVIMVAALMIARETGRPLRAAATTAGALLLVATALLLRNFEAALVVLGAGIFAAAFLQLSLEMSVAPLLWLLPTAVFGFFDGFVLPTNIASLRLSSLIPAAGIFAFNAGALAAALLLLALGVAAGFLVHRKALKVPAPLMRDLSAAALAGLGTFWFLARLGI